MCAHSVCLPTPEEARILIKRGYGPRLATYQLCPDPTQLVFVGPAPKGKEGARALPDTGAACTFYTDGECELHDLGLKPLEGRLAHHDRDPAPIRIHMSTLWRGKTFNSVLAKLLSRAHSATTE
jgi:hypothetical protein